MSNDNENSISLEDKLIALAFVDNGQSIEQVAEMFQSPVEVVKSWVKAHTENNLSKCSNNPVLDINQPKQIDSNQVKTRPKRSCFSQENKLAAIEMYKNGSTISTIAAQFQTSCQLVNQWLKKAKVVKNNVKKSLIHSKPINNEMGTNSHVSSEDKLDAIEMNKNGTRISTIATKYQTNYASVGTRLDKETELKSKCKSSKKSKCKSSKKSKCKNTKNSEETINHGETDRNEFTIEHKIKAIGYLDSGASIDDVANVFKTSIEVVKDWYEIKRKAVAFVDNGELIEEVAYVYGTSVDVVQRWYESIKGNKLSKPQTNSDPLIAWNEEINTKDDKEKKQTESSSESHSTKEHIPVESRKRLRRSKPKQEHCQTHSKKTKIIDDTCIETKLMEEEIIHDDQPTIEDLYQAFCRNLYKNVKEIYDACQKLGNDLIRKHRKTRAQSNLATDQKILSDYIEFRNSDFFQLTSKKYFELEKMFSDQ